MILGLMKLTIDDTKAVEMPIDLNFLAANMTARSGSGYDHD